LVHGPIELDLGVLLVGHHACRLLDQLAVLLLRVGDGLLEQPDLYRYEIDTSEVAEVWRRGSVVASWLLDLTAEALYTDPKLSTFAGRVSDSGEGRWTAKAAIDLGVPAFVLNAALFERFSSRGEADFADRILSAMRKEFGGHDEKAAS
ncbi:MAG: hypothetical protein ACRDYC_04150, partial [Acidimicrobiales bacterium]